MASSGSSLSRRAMDGFMSSAIATAATPGGSSVSARRTGERKSVMRKPIRPPVRPKARPPLRRPMRPLTDEEGEVREFTEDDLAGMRPIAEVDPGMIETIEELRRKLGRPKSESPKVHIGFRLAADVVRGSRRPHGYSPRRGGSARGVIRAGFRGTRRRNARKTFVFKRAGEAAAFRQRRRCNSPAFSAPARSSG